MPQTLLQLARRNPQQQPETNAPTTASRLPTLAGHARIMHEISSTRMGRTGQTVSLIPLLLSSLSLFPFFPSYPFIPFIPSSHPIPFIHSIPFLSLHPLHFVIPSPKKKRKTSRPGTNAPTRAGRLPPLQVSLARSDLDDLDLGYGSMFNGTFEALDCSTSNVL